MMIYIHRKWEVNAQVDQSRILTCAADSVSAQTAPEASRTPSSNSVKSPDLILFEILGMASVRSCDKPIKTQFRCKLVVENDSQEI